MTKVSIIGSGGYTGGELIRILMHHPLVKIVSMHSESQAGKAISSVHADLLPHDDLIFSDTWDPASEIFFLCLGHGRAKSFLEAHPEIQDKIIIDLSHDFRLKTTNNDFVYGLPEAFNDQIKTARHIANPGCFATAIQLALLPLAHHHLLSHDINIHAITGATGAGQGLSETTHFAWRDNNVSAYKPFTHQHLGEISQTLATFMPEHGQLNFIPIRGNFSKGIFCTSFTRNEASLNDILAMYNSYYQNHPFVWISHEPLSLKPVLNTNHCFIHVEKHGTQLLITSVLDNLIKGAAGQAVQNMNLVMGWPENSGLEFKASAF